jgi:phytoene dehydrogenase-like protein
VSGGYDAIVAGAGLNGLTVALYLARAGWRVLVLERGPKVGGAVASGEVTLPGFIHDLYSTNQNLFLGSPVYQEFRSDLERHGLSFAHSDKPNCCLFPDGGRLPLYQDAARMREVLSQLDPGDAAAWDELRAHFEIFRRSLLELYGTPLPSLRAARVVMKAMWREGRAECLDLMRIVLSSARELGESYFRSPEMRTLFAVWGMHLDFGPDVSGGAMFPFLETFTDVDNGIGIARGGASKIVDAMAGLIREFGGEIRVGADVDRIVTRNGRASAVTLGDGEEIAARRAIIANLTPGPLFGRLLRDCPVPAGLRRRAGSFKYGPGTMMVHLALRGKPNWQAGADTADFAYVHIAPYIEDLQATYADAARGVLPASPMLIVGQTTAVDQSRAPEGAHILWIQVRAVPSIIHGDALGRIGAHDWSEAREPYADRVVGKLEEYAPGIGDLIMARAVFSPADLERANPNLVGGDSVGGSHHLAQNFMLRPFPGWSRYRAPIEGLYMCGAGTYPGAGNHALSGYLCAEEILKSGGARGRARAIARRLGIFR